MLLRTKLLTRMDRMDRITEGVMKAVASSQ